MARILVPGTTTALLTVTTKMPSKSWSLPAFKACPSAYMGENVKVVDGVKTNVDKSTICGNCYAGKGMYLWPVVQAAQDARFQWTIQASMNPILGDEWVETMVNAIQDEAKRQIRGGSEHPVFRIHDSGDLFSPAYANMWARVAMACKDVQFWVPTRQWKSKNLHMQAALLALASLPNVSVRPSALRFEDAPPVIPFLAAGTGASKVGYNCPAPSQDGKCLECRKCWDKSTPVVYKAH